MSWAGPEDICLPGCGHSKDARRLHSRTRIIHDPAYYAIRNHLVEFLVARSNTFRDRPPDTYDPKQPPLVRPGLEPAALVEAAAVAHSVSGH